jgi:hypothetical protein
VNNHQAIAVALLEQHGNHQKVVPGLSHLRPKRLSGNLRIRLWKGLRALEILRAMASSIFIGLVEGNILKSILFP